jgi:hypothetical protein
MPLRTDLPPQYTLSDIKPGDWIIYATGDCGVGFMGYNNDSNKGICPKPRQVKSVGKVNLSLVTAYYGRDMVAPEQVIGVFSSQEQARHWYNQAQADYDQRTIEIKQLEAELFRLRTARFQTFCSIAKSGTNR